MECDLIIVPEMKEIYGVRVLFNFDVLTENVVIRSFFRKVKSNMAEEISSAKENKLEFVLTETVESVKAQINAVADDNLISVNWH
jgi:hypothetical protein